MGHLVLGERSPRELHGLLKLGAQEGRVSDIVLGRVLGGQMGAAAALRVEGQSLRIHSHVRQYGPPTAVSERAGLHATATHHADVELGGLQELRRALGAERLEHGCCQGVKGHA